MSLGIRKIISTTFFAIAICSGISIYGQTTQICKKISYQGNIDYTPQVFETIEKYKSGNLLLEFEDGIYHFYPESAQGLYLRVSNNDNSYKRVIFNLDNMRNVVIKGNNTEFVFHGTIVPFYIHNSQNITISGVSFDYDYSFVFEGEVIANNPTEKSADLKINDEVKYIINGKRFFFQGYNWTMPLGENIVFDKNTKAPYYYTSKYDQNNYKRELSAKDLGNRVVRFSGFTNEVPPVGSIYTDKGPHGQNRLYPGIILHTSSDILLENINIYMSGAMALIGENSTNINMQNFNVKLREKSGRYISSSADATHFVNCSGQISFENCSFENMLDDATNVHGTYMEVKEIKDNFIKVQFGHFQQEGFQFAQKGDSLKLIDRGSLLSLYSFKVKDIKWINDNFGVIYSEASFPKIEEEKFIAVENLSQTASVVMKNCSVRNNRARSILISTSKPVLIENNYFNSMMAGILIAGDANKWFESGNVNDVIIRGNTFVNIGIGGYNPQSVLQISPEISTDKRNEGYYHGKIIFENNTVKTFDSQVIYALSVRNLIIRNNTFIQTKDYDPIFNNLPLIDIQNCKFVNVEGNTYQGDKIAEVSSHKTEKINVSRQKGFSKSVFEKPNKFFYQQ